MAGEIATVTGAPWAPTTVTRLLRIGPAVTVAAGLPAYRDGVNILQIAPALHGAKMHTKEGSYPVVVWALVEQDDGSRDVVGLSVGGDRERALVQPDPATFKSYSQTG